MNKIQITPEMKISELLDNFPELEEKLIELAPPFKKLKNPILRKTLARVTTLRQTSKVGGISLAELINNLRISAGQNTIQLEDDSESQHTKPEWVKEENIKISYDARLDLEGGQHPVAKVSKEILTLNFGEIYLLITPFFPGPLINIVKEKGFNTYSTNISESEVYTYIIKST